MVGVEAFFAVAVDLVEGFADGDAPFFDFDLHQGQPVDQDGDIVAIGLAPCLGKLFDDLHFVAG